MAKDIAKSLGVLRSRKGPPLSKADLARSLLDEGYTVNEISKAVPMNYTQVHSINKKRQPMRVDAHGRSISAKEQKHWQEAGKQAREQLGAARSEWGPAATTPRRTSLKPMKSPVIDAIKKGKPIDISKIGITKRVGKLRTPGMPSDTDVGECANCGYDLVIRYDSKLGQMFFVHVNVSQEEYMSTVQFCHGVPKVLLA